MELPITERQFNALARVSGFSANSKTHKAMKMIFVEGKRNSEVAAICDLTASVVGNAKNKMLNVHSSLPGRIALIQEALGQ